MHSPAAVALTPRLAAILRLDMPAADSLSTSWILRMGNLGPGIAPLPLGKGANPCRFADHPTAPVTPVHRLVAIARNGWSRSSGVRTSSGLPREPPAGRRPDHASQCDRDRRARAEAGGWRRGRGRLA